MCVVTAAALLLGVCAVEQAAAAGTTRAGELPVVHKAPDQIASASAVLDAPGPVATIPTNQLDPKRAFANIQAAGQTVDSSVGQSAVDAAKQLASTTASVPADPSRPNPTPDSGSAQAKQLAPSESYTPFSHKTTDANGQTHVDEYADPAFKQVDGKWVPLSGEILPTVSKQAGAPAATAPGMVKPVEFGASASSMLQFDLGGGPVAVKPAGLRITAPSVTAGDVTYHDVVPNVDLHYATDTSRVKEAFTIRSPLAQSAFTFHLSDPTAQLGELKQLGDGTYLFLGTDTAGTALALPAAVAFAASANPDVKPLPDPLWRYVVVQASGASACNLDATLATPTVVAGYSVMRPDRVRENFDILGRLLSMFDRSGNELRYTYDAQLRLIAVWEPAACNNDVNSARCRKIAFNYGTGSSDHIDVTDPAGRVTTYQRASTSPTANLTSVITRDSLGGNQLERWDYRYKGDANTSSCVAPTGALCEVVSPQAQATGQPGTRFDYTTSTIPQVARITERVGGTANTSFDYRSANSYTDVVRDGHAIRYQQIDTTGRVGQVIEGTLSGPGGTITALRQTNYTWDTAGATCRPRDNKVDNDLCSVTKLALAAPANFGNPAGWTMTPDQVSSMTYTPLGQPLSEAQAIGGQNLTTTYGYQTTYTTPDNTATTYTDTPTGLGAVAASPAGAPPSYLYATSDRRFMLPARGNAPAATVANFLTTYAVDANAAIPPGRMDAAHGVTPVCGSGNSGLVCTEAAPQSHVTSFSYDVKGQRASSRTPAANAGFNDGCATPPAGVPICSTTYSYYADTDTDLSVSVSAGGWMRAAVDPYGNFAAFTYDRAGNAVRSWDRDATTGHLVTDYGTGAVNPGTPVETLYRDPATADPLAKPWRYERQQTDQNANKTTWTVDLDGNRTTLRPPRGNAAGANTYDIFQSFDGNDRQTSALPPVENPDHQPGTADDKPTTTSYDGNGDKTVVTDANGHQTVTVYDAVSRPTAMLLTRGAWDSQTAPPTCVNSTGNPNKGPIADNKTLCTATTTYDGQDHKIRVVDAASGTAYVAYDAIGRTTQQYVQRTSAPSPTYTTGAWNYDTAGNALDSCPPRQAAEEGACTPTAHFATHTTYDELNRPLAATAYRETIDSSGTKVAGSWAPLTTVTAYPLAQNSLQVTDPNGHQTSVISDLLDRHTTTIVPRDTAASVSDTTKTTYSPSGDVNSVDIRQTNAPSPTELLAYRYDPGHRLVDTVDAATTATAAANSDSYKAVEGTAPANLRTRHAYDNDGNIVATWDARAFTSSVTTPDNRFLTRVDYDADGRPIANWQPYYDTTNHTAINPDIELQECPATSAGYQPQPASGANFPAGVGVCVTRVEHDPVGNITKLTNPTATNPSNAARYNTYTYTDDNLAALFEMPNPAPVGGSEPARVQTTYRYDAAGRPTRTTGSAQPNGQWSTQTSYSPDGLTTATQSPAGVDPVTQAEERTTVAYNANGQPINATGYANTPGRQGAGQPSTIQNTSYYADGKTYEVATPVTGVNAGTIATHYGYDPNGNPTTVWSPSAVAHAANNPTGMATVNLFTDDNLLKATVDPISAPDTRRATTYAYDPAGRKLSQTVNEITGINPYDNTKITRAGGTQSITYTPNGWAATETARDGIQIQHTYAANGLETGTTQYDPAHTVQSTITNDYLLNGLLRDSSTTVAGGTPAYSTKYNGFKYTADGLPYAQITGNDSTFTTADQVETFAYNDARTLSGVTSVGFGRSNDHWALTDDRLGRPTTMVDPNGRQTDYAYSLPGNLIAKTFRSAGATSAALDTWTYDYDGQNRVTGRHRNQPNAQYPPGTAAASNDTYHYDEASRLDTVNAGAVGYDADSNRTSYNGTASTYRADNSINTQAGVAFSYNPEGDLTNDGCRTYSYDGFDRVSGSVALPCGGAGSVTYGYDGLNRQVQTNNTGPPSETRQVHYVGTSTTRWTEDSSDPTKTGHYTLTPDGHTLAVTDTATTPNYNNTESDGHGNVVLATTPSGVACAVDLDAWGQPRNNQAANPCVNGIGGTATTPNTSWYGGNRRDTNTGTYQNGARTYNPATANWLTPDNYRAGSAAKNLSIGVDPFTQNRYSYVNGDPVNLIDPTGHFGWGDAFGAFINGLKQLGGVVVGFAKGAIGTVTGLYGLAKDPGQLVELGKALIKDPGNTAKALLKGITKAARDDVKNGKYGEALGDVLFQIAMIAGPKAIDALAKTGEGIKVLEAAGETADGINAAAELSNTEKLAAVAKPAAESEKAAETTKLAKDAADAKVTADTTGAAADATADASAGAAASGGGSSAGAATPASTSTAPAAAESESGLASELAGACHSFAPATLVVLADGFTKAISEVAVGDRVRTTDPATGKTVIRTVTALHRNHDTDLADLVVRDGDGHESTVHTTQLHRFWDDTRHDWVDAADLTAGDRLHTDDGAAVVVESARSFTGLQWMYDLTVDDVHTYYVVAGDERVLVHNCGGLDALSESGSALDPADAGGQLTRAGRAFSKASEVFGPTSGGPSAVNGAGQNALDEILTNPGTVVNTMPGGHFAGGQAFISPGGIGAVFGPDGTFQYFGWMTP
ncbi:MAG: polymorphic toxin-type HINT domain-containing protein [Acidimicrobiales bacterium]